MSSETKVCQNCQKRFAIEPEDFDFYRKINVPPPTFCPECRFQRRLAWRNERTLYRRKCDLCGEMKISSFSPGVRVPVYCPPCWWSDKWDPLSYGLNLDFTRPFLDQFNELKNKVPQQGLSVAASTMIRSDYCHMANDLKDCYMVTHANDDEDCFHSSAIIFCKNSGELLSCKECELCLENIQCEKNNRVFFSLDCESCYNMTFCKNCVGCSDCFGCANLRNKQYYIFNKSYSKEKYFEELKKYDIRSYKTFCEVRKAVASLWLHYPQKYIHGRHNGNVSGDYVYNSKNAFGCYVVNSVEDSKFCSYLTDKPVAQCYDYTEWGFGAELIYESVNVGQGASNIKFGQMCWGNIKNIDYASFCVGSEDLFGCVSLRNKNYCILNKQYTKEEYDELREKIIQHMIKMPYVDGKGREYKYGEFFPAESSFWGYNETTAQEYFPLSEEEIAEAGYFLTNIEEYKGHYEPTLKAADIPDDINDAQSEIPNEIIECGLCQRAYRIVFQEFEFYKNQEIALPRACPECRYRNRFRQRNLFRLYDRKCQCVGSSSENGIYNNTVKHAHESAPCPNEFRTTFPPDSLEIVYCEECYQSEIV